jgi:hypothetical protein
MGRPFLAGLPALCLLAFAGAATCGQSPPLRQGNVRGICLTIEGNGATTGNVRLLGLARHLVGDWGYLRHGVNPSDDIEATRRAVAMVRAYHLIPISGGAEPDKQFRGQKGEWPRLDPDGTMRTAARAKAAVWRKAYEAHIPFYAIEVLNEINGKWPADKYAQWLYDLAVEVKRAYPGLKVCSCGMAGSGADYYDELLRIKPQLKDVVDFWGLHPYGANHPPEFRPDDTALRSFELTAAVLQKHGVNPIRLMCTETGYELEAGNTGKDPKYPPINETNRADYMARAFRRYYFPDPRIECVTPFMLWDFPWNNWDGWDFVYPDGRPRPIYEAMAALKDIPGGKDWLPTGRGRIAGRITWQNTDIGIPRAVVYTDPGLYGAVTDDTGRFEIRGLPEGRYRVGAFCDGFTSLKPRTLTVRRDEPVAFHGQMDRESLIDGAFGPPNRRAGRPLTPRESGVKGRQATPPGWMRIGNSDTPDTFAMDETLRFRGRPTLRITVAKGRTAGLLKYGGYASAYPNEVFIAEVSVRSRNAGVETGGGPWLALDLTTGRGEVISTAKAFLPDFTANGNWQRITVAALAPARSSRVRVSFGVEGAEGTFSFSEPFVGEADFPLPTDAAYRTTGYVPPLYELNKPLFAQAITDVKLRNPGLKAAALTGRVTDFRGRPLKRTVVATDSPLFVAVTDDNGGFTLTAPAGKPVRVRAFPPNETPAISSSLELTGGEHRTLSLQTAAPPAPAQLVNGGFNAFNKQEAGLIPGWTSYGTTDGACASGRTIFKATSFEGEGMYVAQSGSNTKNGGAYQTVQARPGQAYRLTGRVYTRTEGDGKKPIDNNCRLGIDPTGGRDPNSPDVVWTNRTESEQKWTLLSVEVTAQSSRITVFIRHEMRRANTWNLTLFDDIQLDKVP